jgi:phytoene synthase
VSDPNPQSPIPNPELDALIRRVDEDRWLASRFAPEGARARLIALYAVNYEIARTAEVVREAPLGAIRLEWWRSALAELEEGRGPREHPALQALSQTQARAAGELRVLAEAHTLDFDPAPFAAWDDVEAYIDRTAGIVMRLAIDACAPEASENLSALASSAAQAWGYAGLLRAAPLWRARGRTPFPREGRGRDEMLLRAKAAHTAAHASIPAPKAAFPAIGYVALLPSYLRALHRGAPAPSLLSRQVRLVIAAAQGRV